METLVMNAAFWRGKRVLITGHTGFKGNWLAVWLRQLGAEVGGLALPPATTPNLFELAQDAGDPHSVFADIRDLDAVKSVFREFRPEIVLHLAAQAIVRASYQDPVATYATNVMGTVHVLEAARASGVRVLINVTSDKCYDNQEWVWGYRETDRLGGKDPYASSKACAELVMSAYRTSFFSGADQIGLASARAGNVIGGGDWAQDRLIPDIVAALRGGQPIPVRNPDAVRPWQHVLEPLSGYLLLAERLWDDPGAFSSEWNFGPDPDSVRPVRWLVDHIASHWGLPATTWIAQAGEHPHEARLLALDSSKARAQLGWSPRWTLDRAAAAVVEWYKAFDRGAPVRPIMVDQISAFMNTTQDGQASRHAGIEIGSIGMTTTSATEPAGRPLTEIKGCEVCGGTRLLPVLDLGRHPLCDDLVAVGDPRQCREYPINIDFCSTCTTAHQRFQVPKENLFPDDYHYRSRFTADVLSGMRSLVASCVERLGPLTGKVVLDVGCNDGSLLDFFRDVGAKTAGIEPTGAGRDAAAKGHFVVQDYLSNQTAAAIRDGVGTPDLITFTNVFAHIEDLSGVLAALKTVLGPNTAIVIENHYLGAVLDRHQFDTFYHEHPRTYSYQSFDFIARSLGLDIIDVEFPARYGGNIRVTLGHGAPSASGKATAADVVTREKNFLADFGQLARDVDLWKDRKGREIKAIVAQHGPIRAKAFPGRAAILVKLLGLTEKEVVAVHEKPGSIKIGHYVPGTRIPIVSDDALFAAGDHGKPLLNLAWHISGEIRHYLRDNGYNGPVVDVLGPDDFHA